MACCVKSDSPTKTSELSGRIAGEQIEFTAMGGVQCEIRIIAGATGVEATGRTDLFIKYLVAARRDDSGRWDAELKRVVPVVAEPPIADVDRIGGGIV